ncbi:unnamed protein product [Arctia plantaginis]|uniref:SEFIR domain-containing protein n=1 Tax=Arctia plantaginis TaxID=874455 RepID=A0A8S0ZQL8_ARCPL|nr:unnamed protein product [Arctia plantaginis]
MFVAVVLLCLLCLTEGHLVEYKCGTIGDKYVEFTPVVNVPGRYTLKLCTLKNPNVTDWRVELWFYDGPNCNKTNPKFRVHSIFEEPINNPTNCSNVCYIVNFDVVFAACYSIRSEFKPDKKTHKIDDSFFPVQNNLTIDMFRKSTPKVINIPKDKDVSIRWIYAMPIPHNYSVLVKRKQGDEDNYKEYLIPAPGSCKVSDTNQLICDLVLPPGCYIAFLRFEAPWYPVLNSQTEISYKFCRTSARPPVVVVGVGRAAWWALGGALVGAAALLLSVALRRALRSRDYHKRVIAAWLGARESEPARVVYEGPTEYNILLLYAREGEHGQRAVDALKDLLQQTITGQVLDIYAAAVTAQAAPASSAWLRSVLQHARTKVLLLQSPALLTLYSTRLKEPAMQLSEPLLGRGAMYRRPHWGDKLLQLALCLMTENVSAHHLYHKYYLATYEGLSGEVVPQLVPYRRYVLPRAAPALLRDLAPPAPTPAGEQPPPLDQYYGVVDEFVAHVLHNPDYLQEELVTLAGPSGDDL